MPLKKMEQTTRTILFEEFNPEKATLANILNSPIKDRDEVLKNIKNDLMVTSFKEFIKKFNPTIYAKYIESDDLDKVGFDVEYNLVKPEDFIEGVDRKIIITEHELWNALTNLYANKGMTSLSEFDFNFKDITSLLTPEKDKEKVSNLKSDLSYSFRKYKELSKIDPQKRIFAQRIKELLKKVDETFDNPMQILALSMTETKKIIDAMEKNKDQNGNSGNAIELKQRVMISYDEKGNIKPIKIESSETGTLRIENKDDQKLIELIGNSYDEKAPNGIKNSNYVRELVVSSYTNRSMEEIPLTQEDLKKKSDIEYNTYINAQEKFMNQVMYLVEKIMGVKTFFDHADLEGNLNSGLIITNCSLSRIAEDEDLLKKFEDFVNGLNNNTPNKKEKIWFTIIPNVKDENSEKENKNDIKAKNSNNIGNVSKVVKVLSKEKIMTFFNCKTSKETSFRGLDIEKIENYRKIMKEFPSDNIELTKQLVFAYPNFSLLPESVGIQELGEKYENGLEDEWEYDFLDEEFDLDTADNQHVLKIPGAYIDASYVAAGIVVAYQNEDYLSALGYKTFDKEKLPGVRFDLEENFYDSKRRIKTKFNPESNFQLENKIKENIEKDKLGFFFWRDTGKNQIAVSQSRTLSKDDSGKYEEIYKTLVENFVQVHVENLESNTKADIESTFSAWERHKAEKHANNILGPQDSIEIDDSNGKTIDINLKMSGSKPRLKIQVNNKK